MIFIKQQPDNIGAIASTLCLLHCIITPFLFMVQAGSLTGLNTAPMWWGFLDLFFLIVSFFAILRSARITKSNFVKKYLWLSWLLLFVIIFNEKIEWLPIHENVIYFPAIALILLHLYNKKFCQCKSRRTIEP